MIMPKSQRWLDPILENLPEATVQQKVKTLNLWITHKGEIINCCDHEAAASLYVKENNLLVECVDWMKDTPYQFRDYRSFVIFSKGWIRIAGGINNKDGIGVSIAEKVAHEAYSTFNNYAKVLYVDYYTVDVCYEDNRPEVSKNYSNDKREIEAMLRCIGTK